MIGKGTVERGAGGSKRKSDAVRVQIEMGKMPLDVSLSSNKQRSPRRFRCLGLVNERQPFQSKQRQPQGLIEQETTLKPRKAVHMGGEKLHLISQYRCKTRLAKRLCQGTCRRHCSAERGFDILAP